MKLGAPNLSETTNYYEILEVTEQAPSHEIHKAYTRAKATYSAENPALYSMFSPEETRELLRLIEEAYSVLGNPATRRSYDESRLNGQRPSHVTIVPTPPATPTQALDPNRLANEHRALPDFAAPSAGDSSAPGSPTAKAPLPEGVGKTLLSTYKIDDSFEEELKRTVDFDGSALQRVRLYKNVSIDRLSESTRISRPYLMAVETNDYKSLPAAVFTRGFIVQIARILGLNENLVATSYIKIFKAGGGK